jgi:hypothetical protein
MLATLAADLQARPFYTRGMRHFRSNAIVTGVIVTAQVLLAQSPMNARMAR